MRRGKKICSPSQGIEPWSPAWQAGILATILWRTLLVADVIRPCNNHIPYVQNPYTHTHSSYTHTHSHTSCCNQPTHTYINSSYLPPHHLIQHIFLLTNIHHLYTNNNICIHQLIFSSQCQIVTTNSLTALICSHLPSSAFTIFTFAQSTQRKSNVKISDISIIAHMLVVETHLYCWSFYFYNHVQQFN